jgi:hypothetical protein
MASQQQQQQQQQQQHALQSELHALRSQLAAAQAQLTSAAAAPHPRPMARRAAAGPELLSGLLSGAPDVEAAPPPPGSHGGGLPVSARPPRAPRAARPGGAQGAGGGSARGVLKPQTLLLIGYVFLLHIALMLAFTRPGAGPEPGAGAPSLLPAPDARA